MCPGERATEELEAVWIWIRTITQLVVLAVFANSATLGGSRLFPF